MTEDLKRSLLDRIEGNMEFALEVRLFDLLHLPSCPKQEEKIYGFKPIGAPPPLPSTDSRTVPLSITSESRQPQV
jgi:hypothetical protein